jgi:PTS system nitrogen regulatory IIA component
MHLHDLLLREALLPDLQARDKLGAIAELAAPLALHLHMPCGDLAASLLARERLGSTGIGSGLAIPHGKIEGLSSPLMGFGRSLRGVAFEAIDGRPVHLIFVLLTPADAAGLHLTLLARLSRILKGPTLRDRLLQADSGEAILEAIGEMDTD